MLAGGIYLGYCILVGREHAFNNNGTVLMGYKQFHPYCESLGLKMREICEAVRIGV